MTHAVLVAGEALIDFLPETDTGLAATVEFERQPGGAPANVAVRLAQLGRTPWFWTRVGSDPFGDFLVETLRDRGVSDRFVERDPDAKTTLAFVSGDPDAGSRFAFYRDDTADTRFQPGRVPNEALDSVEWVVVGSVLLASSPSREAMHDLVERARDRGCTVVFDLNARPELWPDADFEQEVRRMLPRVDVLKASLPDVRPAGFAADRSDLDSLFERVHEVGPDTVFLTFGESGAAADATADTRWGPARASHGGFTVDAVDTTGAGDAFTAGVVDALADGSRTLEEVLDHGNAVAAASTLRAGGIADLPSPTTVAETD